MRLVTAIGTLLSIARRSHETEARGLIVALGGRASRTAFEQFGFVVTPAPSDR
jgi:hypothetical protein